MANNISRYKNGMEKLGRRMVDRSLDRKTVSLTMNRRERRAIKSSERTGRPLKLKKI